MKFNFFKSFIFILFSTNLTFCDAAVPWQIGFQDPATPIMEGIINFHNHIMFFLVITGLFVCWLLFRCCVLYSWENNPTVDNFTHSTKLEIIWTVVPALVLMVIAIPSFALLYSMDEMLDPAITLKVIGHQWYWSYEYSDYNHLTEENEGLNFDSYMIAEEDLTVGAFRLLEVDHRVVLPVNTHIRVLVTAADVLHSWAVPAFGVKKDAVPGRLNETWFKPEKTGIFYGMCSELCGVNHQSMPIEIHVVTEQEFNDWVEESKLKYAAKNNLIANKK